MDQASPVTTPISEDALALEFEQRHAADFRYVAPWRQWMEWCGDHWRREETLRAFDLARSVARDAAQKRNTQKREIASSKTVNGIEKLARAARPIAATIEQWDTDPFLLNTPDGTIELGPGSHRLRAHRREDYCSKITAVGPGGGRCPQFMDFLQRVTDGNQELIDFLQRVSGYCLTGSIKEQCMFFFFGTGQNGKSTFLNVLSGILAGYATAAATEVFTAAPFERHSTELAALAGARLVTAIESEQNRQWAEAKIKAMTGGDTVRARFMRRDSFEFTPVCKIIVASNHRPHFTGIDKAIRRRIMLVPWLVTIADQERDNDIGAKLKAEWPAILAWALDGYDQWRTVGLAPPARVEDATADYLDAEDVTKSWIEECCDCTNPLAFTATSALYASWRHWAEQRNETVGTLRALSDLLHDRGFQRARGITVRGFKGIKLDTGEDRQASRGWKRDDAE